MRLNIECVRDILLFIEKSTDNDSLSVSSEKIISALTDYSNSDIYYHIRQIHKYKYVDNVFYADNEPLIIGGLTPDGRDFVDNIRDNKVWSYTKKALSSISSVSLPILGSLAEKQVSKILGLG